MGLMAHDGFDDDWDDDLGWIDVPARPESGPAGAPPATIAGRRDDAAADGSRGPAGERIARSNGPGERGGATSPTAGAPQVRDEFASPTDANSSHGSRTTERDGSADPDAPLELEDDDWQVAPPPVPARRASAGDGHGPSGRRRRRGPLGSPVVLLALYSVAGIALVVLAVNLLSGGLSGDDPPRPVPAADRQPVEEAAPAPTAVATATPVATPAVSDFELRRREEAAAAARTAAIAAAARAEKAARAAERRRIMRERRERARAKARSRARARAEARRRAASPPAAATDPAAAAPATPPPAAPAPAPAPSGGGGGGGGGNSCEFCIG